MQGSTQSNRIEELIKGKMRLKKKLRLFKKIKLKIRNYSTFFSSFHDRI